MLCLLLSGGGSVEAQVSTPGWWQSKQQILNILDSTQITAGISQELAYFTTAFTVLGMGLVMIAAIRRVANARSGDESMGWVAGMVMTVALMVVGPKLGNGVFGAADELAKQSKYSNSDSIQTAWLALQTMLPTSSATLDVLETDQEVVDPEEDPTKQDAAWTKRAWDWMKRSWGAMKNASTSFIGGIRAAANNILIFIVLLIPSIALLIAMVVMAFGTFFREILHQVMDVLLPLMLAMLSFAPTRGAAVTYLVRYISVALWPVAWALGNAVAIAMLVRTMNWVVSSCREVLIAANANAKIGDVLSNGILTMAAPLMSWGLLVILLFMILFSSILLIVSAFAAPAALSQTLTRGTCFAQAQLQQALTATGGALTALSGPGGGTALGAAGLAGGGIAGSARAGFAGVAGRLGAVAAAGGPIGVAAAVASSVLGGAARMAATGRSVAGDEFTTQSARSVTPSARSILETLDSADGRSRPVPKMRT